MKIPRHRCVNCGMLAVTRRVISSAGMSSEYVYICRAAKACEKRLKARCGIIYSAAVANPPKKRKVA
jgi:hypothetical protein